MIFDPWCSSLPVRRAGCAAALTAVAALVLSGCGAGASAAGTTSPASSPAQSRHAPVVHGASAAGSSSAGAGSPSASPASQWQTYRNSRFGFQVEVPRAFIAAQPPNERGQTYHNADGHTEVTASVSDAGGGATLSSVTDKYATDLRRRGDLTSSHTDAQASSFRVSGYLYGGRYAEDVYGVVHGQRAYLLVWTYPRTERGTVEPWVRHSIATFHPGP